MLVKELLEGFKNKSLTKTTVSEMYNVHPRTVQRKLSNAGFKWNTVTAVYEYTGDNENIMNVDVEDILKAENVKASSKPNTVKKKSSKSTNNNISNSKKASIDKSEMDVIDVLLLGKKKDSNRTYRGFYFDNDVLEIIDTVGSGNKSELINQALRKVFREKGLL